MPLPIDPAFSVVPAILPVGALRARFRHALDLGVAARWLGFGGIRVEDDVQVRPEGGASLTPQLPRTVAELEALVGSGGPLPF